MFRNYKFLLAGLLAAFSLGLFALSQAEEKEDEEEAVKIAYEKMPEPVRKAMGAQFGADAKLGGEKETEDGVTLYEIEGQKGDAKTSIKLTESGELLEVEQVSSLDKTPSGVQAKLKKKFPDGQIVKVEAVEIHFYEVKIQGKNGKAKEVRILPSGEIMEHEDEDEE